MGKKFILLVFFCIFFKMYYNLGTKKSLVTGSLRRRSASPTPLTGYNSNVGNNFKHFCIHSRKPFVDSYFGWGALNGRLKKAKVENGTF
jgi:hypothetical protein